MPLLKTAIGNGTVELVIGVPETEDTVGVGVVDGVVDGVDPGEPHVYLKVGVESEEGDALGDVQLKALKAARELIGAEISRITQLQQGR